LSIEDFTVARAQNVSELRDLALAAAREAGFDLCGIAGIEPSARLAAFAPWVDSGQAGDMRYLARRGESGRYLREAVREAWPWAQAVICGSCTRCIDACPVPEPLRPGMGNNLIGCDICQDVCPWNRRAPLTHAPEFQPRPGLVAPLLLELASLSEAAYRERFRHSAAKRAKFSGLRRSLAIAMGNSGNPAFLSTLQLWQRADDAVLAEHAAWAAARIAKENPLDGSIAAVATAADDHCHGAP
jgi:epoxyqueuosine reductase QueG